MDVFEMLRGGCDLADHYDVSAVSRFLPALLLRAAGQPHHLARYQSLCAGNPRAERIALYASMDFSEVLLNAGLFNGSISHSAADLHGVSCENNEGLFKRGPAMGRTASDVIREYSKHKTGDIVADEGDDSCSAYEDEEREGRDDAMDDLSDTHSNPHDVFPEDSPGGGVDNIGSEDALWWAHQEVDALEDPVAAEQERVELEFEIASEARRVHLLVHELQHMLSSADSPCSHLFDSPALLEELLCMLPVVLAKCQALSPVATARALLASMHAPQLVSCIVANLPQCLSAVVKMLAAACAAGGCRTLPLDSTTPSPGPGTSTECSAAQDWALRASRAAEACLLEICTMSASTRGEVRMALKATRAAPHLAMHLTLAHLKDEVEFVSAVVYESAASREWLLESLNKEAQALATPTSPTIISDEFGASALLAHLEKSLLHRARQAVVGRCWKGDAHANLRLFCALLACGVMPLPSLLADFWLSELAKLRAVTAQTVNLFSALLFLLAANGAPLEDLEAPVTVAVLAAANHVFLNHNSKNNDNCDKDLECALHTDPEVLAQSTWWRTHLMASMQGASAINDLLGWCLGVPHVPVSEPALLKMKAVLSLSTALHAPSAAAALAACPLPRHLRQGLCYNHPAVLVAESATQLLASGVIQHAEVDLVPAIQAAVETAQEPLHPILPSLLSAFAHAAMTPAPATAAIPPCSVVSGLPLNLLKGLFLRAPEGSEVRSSRGGVTRRGIGNLQLRCVLGAYYVLCCEEARNLPHTGARQDVPNPVCGYDAEEWELLLASVPVKSFVKHMQAVPGYAALLPKWMGLAARFIPERSFSLLAMDDDVPRCFSTAAEMVAASAYAPAGATSADAAPLANTSALDHDTARNYLANALANPLAAATYLQALVLEGSKEVDWEMDSSGKWPHGEMVVKTLAPRLAHPLCERRLHLLFVRWWRQLPLATRGVLLPVLTSTWGGEEHDEDGSTKMLVGSMTEMQCAPLSLLTCLHRVRRASLLVNLLLDELTPLLGAARRRVLLSQAVRSEEVSVVALAQSSAVVQMLLEACHLNTLRPTSGDGEEDADEDSDEACRIIFAYISGMFIEDPVLLKCVHFQGYNVGMVRAVVERIPCVHACIAFLQELLAQPQPAIQLFASVLAAELAAKYPLEGSLAAAQTALGLAMKATESGDHSFLEASLEALGRAAATLPAMLPDALTVFHRCVNSPSDSLRLCAETAYSSMLERRVLVGHATFGENSSHR